MPTHIGSSNWLKVEAGTLHTVALRNDHQIFTWGNNIYGQLGDGATVNRTSPIHIGVAHNWNNIVAGSYHTIARKVGTDTLWVSGSNRNGQLGDGTTTNRTSLVEIANDKAWSKIATGDSHTVALEYVSGGHVLWAWGENSSGQLGDGTLTQHNTPVQIGSENDWANVFAGSFRTYAIKMDGSLWGWGSSNGILGDGGVVPRKTPTQIGADTDWKEVGVGQDHTVAIKTDGSLWVWGNNDNGVLGLERILTPTMPQPRR